MLKEVYEQPEAIRQTILQHIDPATRAVRPDRFPWTPEEVAALRRVTIVASGASRHAGLCGKLMIEDLAGIPVEVEHASEYGYRKPTNGKGSLVIAITQSGETADTTAAQRIAKENGMKTLSISNVVELHHRPRGRCQLLHPRGQGNRNSRHQELYHSTHRALHAGAVSRCAERDADRRRSHRARRSLIRPCPTSSSNRLTASMPKPKPLPAISTTTRCSCSWDAACTTPSPSKAH